MDFKKLEGENILTLSKFDVELDNRGLLLIQGDNKDDTSARSNGAGKSSVIDALCWCLYGTTARGVTGDAIVNNKAKKDAWAAVTLIDGGFEYRIVRYRKHKTCKNMVTISQRDLSTGVGTDISKGTDKETQAVIEKVIGSTLEVFTASVYAGQEQMPDLPGMTDKQLKLLIEEAAGVEILAEAYVEARDQHNKVKATYEGILSAIETTQLSRASSVTDLENARDLEKQFEDGRKARAAAVLAGITPLNEKIATLQASVDAVDVPSLEKVVADCKAILDARSAKEAELREIGRKAAKIDRERVPYAADFTSIGKQIENLNKSINDMDSLIGTPCGECGKDYCEHDLEAAKKARLEQIGKLTSERDDIAAAYKSLSAAYEQVLEEEEAFRKAMPDVSEVAAKSNEAQTQLKNVALANAAIDKLKGDIDNIRAEAKRKLTEPNTQTALVTSAQQRIDAADTKLAELAKKRAEVEDQALLLADAVKVFGPAGVRAHILDTVTPFLNERTAEYLGSLSDGNIHATWSTLTKSAKGDLKEKFSIEVSNDKGGDSFAALSGGEKRKVRLGCMMALQDMVAGRASKPINLFAADEIDHALDDVAIERLMGILAKKAKERGTVLVISHNEMDDWIPNVITVTKSGGVSTLSGETARVI